MLARRNTEQYPVMPEGLTLEDCAKAIGKKLGRLVKSEELHYVGIKRHAVTRVGRKQVPISRQVYRLVIHPDEVDALAKAYEAQYPASEGQ